MLNLTRVYCDAPTPGDHLRYSPEISSSRKPVVVWNLTRTCNLACAHCYTASDAQRYEGELSTEEAMAVLRDLADYGCPVVILSGGEPLLRKDLLSLAEAATDWGVKPVLSTNGTLITRDMARRIRQSGIRYVGISLDGVGDVNDLFRGVPGAFRRAVEGIRNCLSEHLRTGIRFTITRHNSFHVEDLFQLAIVEGVQRLCFYHLVYVGRGSDIRRDDLDPAEKRRLMDKILRRTEEVWLSGREMEVLTVDNSADAAYVYLRLKERNGSRAERALQILRWNGGNSSGHGIACIDERGRVHPDQFWRHLDLGDVRERPFSEIWEDESHPLLRALRNRKSLLKGKCSRCAFLDICNGGLRVRAEAATGELWAPDPACYLTEREVTEGRLYET
jgi:radical SAM protein with 4Fe4S-binding SPASM domain